jgi:hypothetical protein
MLIAFRNRGLNTCYLQGYPKVVAIRSAQSSTAVGSLSTYLGGLTPDTTPPLVTLKPGSTASVVVSAGDNPVPVTSACEHEHYRFVTVSLPGKPGVKKLSAELPKEGTSLPGCSRVQVTPFQKGVTWFGG